MSTVVTSALLLAVPLVLAGMGGLLHRASGVVNIGLEGQMLVGALLGLVASSMTGNWILGMLAGGLVGGIASYLMTLVITRLDANEIIVGLGFNIVVTGIIGFVLKWQLGVSGTLRLDGVDRIPRFDIPGLSSVPGLREVFGDKDIVFWFTVLLVPAIMWMLANTRYGLRLRASGDAPAAAESLGVRIKRMRESAGFLAGLFAGLGGAYLSLGQVGLFNIQMIAGRGFIALAAFYFGRNRPVPTALACLLFAFFDALQVSLQTGSSSGQLLTALPYVMVVLALAVSAYQAKNSRKANA